MIDWGWFYFITKPMFVLLDYFFHLFGNFGVSILLVTVLIKLLFFPLANKSYASMAKMKSVQPQLAALKERYPDDRNDDGIRFAWDDAVAYPAPSAPGTPAGTAVRMRGSRSLCSSAPSMSARSVGSSSAPDS